MKIENQVVSLELAKKLKELGFKQNSLWYHDRLSDCLDGRKDWSIHDRGRFERLIFEERYSAYTVAELGEMLPFAYFSTRFWSDYKVTFEYLKENTNEQHREHADTEANARAKMLIYLKENKLI